LLASLTLMFIRNGNRINTFKFNTVFSLIFKLLLGWVKKSKNQLNRENQKKNNRKNRLKFWKNWLVRFSFISKKTNRTEPKPKKTEPNQKNQAKIEPNRFEPVFVLKNRTEPKSVGLNRFRFFFFKNSVWLFFW
jgi:hypothetical protein